MRKQGRKKYRVYVCFMNLEKVYGRVNWKALWQVLRMYDASGKLLNGIRNIYVNSLVGVRVKGCESKCFKINSSIR